MRISNGAGPRQEKAPKPDLQAVLLHYGVDAPRSGNYTCVAHDETTPSMSVNLDEQVVQCFSCGFAGDAFNIVMRKEGLTFGEAAKFATDSRFDVAHNADPGRGGVLGRPRPRGKVEKRMGRGGPAWKRPW